MRISGIAKIASEIEADGEFCSCYCSFFASGECLLYRNHLEKTFSVLKNTEQRFGEGTQKYKPSFIRCESCARDFQEQETEKGNHA